MWVQVPGYGPVERSTPQVSPPWKRMGIGIEALEFGKLGDGIGWGRSWFSDMGLSLKKVGGPPYMVSINKRLDVFLF